MDLKMMLLPMKQHLRPQKTSYFKADFDWALKQFKELKSANTQLIANDALEYFLLINDNTVLTLPKQPWRYLRRGLFIVSKSKCRGNHAVSVHLQKFKGQEIESVTLLRLGTIYEK
jgi:hypothetical protein